MLSCLRALGINVAATGVEFEGLVLEMARGVAIVTADSASLLSRRFSRSTPAEDDVDAQSISLSSLSFSAKEFEE